MKKFIGSSAANHFFASKTSFFLHIQRINSSFFVLFYLLSCLPRHSRCDLKSFLRIFFLSFREFVSFLPCLVVNLCLQGTYFLFLVNFWYYGYMYWFPKKHQCICRLLSTLNKGRSLLSGCQSLFAWHFGLYSWYVWKYI